MNRKETKRGGATSMPARTGASVAVSVLVAGIVLVVEGLGLRAAGSGRSPAEWGNALLLYGIFGYLIGLLAAVPLLFRTGGSRTRLAAAGFPLFVLLLAVGGFWSNQWEGTGAVRSVRGLLSNGLLLAAALGVASLGARAIAPLLRRGEDRIGRGGGLAVLLLLPLGFFLLTLPSGVVTVRRAPAPPPAKGPPVVVVLLDTLRRDHLGCYGYPKETSPNIDRLAAEGILFLDSHTGGCRTIPSLGTLFTGTSPSAHGVMSAGHEIRRDRETIAERFRSAGYRTAGFIDNPTADPRIGFGRGFELFRPARFPFNAFGRKTALELLGIRLARHDSSPGPESMVPRALEWLAADRSRPPFLYLHLLDPHSPYEPPREDALRFLPEGIEAWHRAPPRIDPYHGHVGWYMWDEIEEGPRVTDGERQIMTALYDGEIRAVDRWVGRLFAGLREIGMYDDAIILFLSDHGEEFDDHGGWFHGRSFFEEMVGMPLILRLPGGASGGARSCLSLDMVDLYPTLCGLAGIDGPEEVQGVDYADAIRRGGPVPDAPRSLLEEPPHLYGIRRGEWKLVVRVRPEGERIRLYDLAADPEERIDFASAEEETTALLAAVLAGEIDAARALAAGGAARAGGGIDPETRRQLKALGYVD